MYYYSSCTFGNRNLAMLSFHGNFIQGVSEKCNPAANDEEQKRTET